MNSTTNNHSNTITHHATHSHHQTPTTPPQPSPTTPPPPPLPLRWPSGPGVRLESGRLGFESRFPYGDYSGSSLPSNLKTGTLVDTLLDAWRHSLVGLVVKASASRAEDPGFESRLRRNFFRGRVIPVTSKLALQWLPCQTPGVIRSALGLVGPASVYCDWVR